MAGSSGLRAAWASAKRDELQTQIPVFVKGINAFGSLKLYPESLPHSSAGLPEERNPLRGSLCDFRVGYQHV